MATFKRDLGSWGDSDSGSGISNNPHGNSSMNYGHGHHTSSNLIDTPRQQSHRGGSTGTPVGRNVSSHTAATTLPTPRAFLPTTTTPSAYNVIPTTEVAP
eukprot:PhF_6_TR32564/c0_g1_i1/m.48196